MHVARRRQERNSSAVCFGVSFAVHVGFLAVAAVVPPPVSGFESVEPEVSERFASLSVTERPEQERRDPPEVQSRIVDVFQSHAPGARKRDVGPDEEKERRTEKEETPSKATETNRSSDRNSVEEAGILGTSVESGFAGNESDSIGADAIHALGNLKGRETAAASGFGGLDLGSAVRGGGGGMSERGLDIGDVHPRRGAAGFVCFGCTNCPGYTVDADESDPAADDPDDEVCGGGGVSEEGIGIGGDSNLPPGRLRIAPPESDDPAVKDAVRKLSRRHGPELRRCYRKSLVDAPDLQGRVEFQLSVDPTGSVVVAEPLESTLENRNAMRCLVSELQTWRLANHSSQSFTEARIELLFEPN